MYFDTTSNGPPGISRNSFRGPHYFATDLSIIKQFKVRETVTVDVRANLYNLFNNLNLTPFNSNTDPTRVTLATFGTATSGLAGRVGELQIRFNF